MSEFTKCVFEGNPPEGFSSWSEWCSKEPFIGVVIKARQTTGAVDLGDSSALEVGSTPEVLSAGQGESTPAPNH